MLSLPFITPMPVDHRAEPFDHADWLFELKYDGFRALAFIDDGCCLVSRNGHAFRSFASLNAEVEFALRKHRAVVDGEIVCLDDRGRAQFYDLLYRRADPVFIAFDLLWLDGDDLRYAPLTERKQRLQSLLRGTTTRVLFADHVEANGAALYERVCGIDVEGIVAKYKYGNYTSNPEATTWFKIRNRAYSQMMDRAEHFERERHQEPVPGWHCCDLACLNAVEALR